MISIIIPIYNEAENIAPLHQRISEVMEELGRPYEVIFINDGSTDLSLKQLEHCAKADSRVRIIRFRRNFGQTAAIMAGFDYASGDVLIPMDGDLQNDPGDIPLLLQYIDQGYDVVSGWRKQRRDAFFSRRLVSILANWLIAFVTKVKLHDFGCTLKAYRADILKDVKLYGEMHRFIPVHAMWEGAAITEVEVRHHPRTRGVSKYGINRTFKVLLDLIFIAFMDRYIGKPIYLFGGFGLLNFLIAFGAVTASIYFKFFGDKSFIETPLPLLAVVSFISGLFCVLMGLLAEMIIRIYHQIHGKRTYVTAKWQRDEAIANSQEVTTSSVDGSNQGLNRPLRAGQP